MSRDPAQNGDNWFAYCNNDPVNCADPTGLQARGHHVIPQEIWKNGRASDAATDVFDQITTGELPKGAHQFDKAHRAYNEAVKEQWEKFLKEKGTSASKVTRDQAVEFADRIAKSKDSRIASYLDRMYKAAGKPRIRGFYDAVPHDLLDAAVFYAIDDVMMKIQLAKRVAAEAMKQLPRLWPLIRGTGEPLSFRWGF